MKSPKQVGHLHDEDVEWLHGGGKVPCSQGSFPRPLIQEQASKYLWGVP